MLKEAIEKLIEIAGPEGICINDKHFLISKDGNSVTEIKPEFEFPRTLNLFSLEALIAMVTTEASETYNTPFYINVCGHDEVICYTQPLEKLRNERAVLYYVKVKDVPGWSMKVELPFVEALIAIRTQFQQTPDAEYLLRILSDISNSAKVTFSDNGMASSVVTKKGIDLQANELIRPIVSLKPYRTFQEVDQPSSEFHIRISERDIKFIEADGGMWMLTARRTIAEYLSQKLSGLIDAGTVIVTI